MSVRWLVLLLPLLGACAPLGELRPASGMMPGKSMEIGSGVVHVSPRQYVDESPNNTGMLWFSADTSRSRLINLSAVSAFDTNALAVGGAIRINPFRYDRFAGGVELQAGYAWGALVLPAAVRLFDQTWLYASPRFGTLGRSPSFSAPVGLSVRVWNGLALRAEVQTSWEDFKYYNRRVHTALGVAWQW